MRYVAYLAFALVSILMWGGLLVWLFLRDYGCGEGQVAPVCASGPSRVGYALLWLSLPLTALIFTFYRKMVRRVLPPRDRTWRDQ
jgi:hypothetical protein